MSAKEELTQIVIEHPEIVPFITGVLDDYERDKKAVLEIWPDLTEDDLQKLFEMTCNRWYNKWVNKA